MKFYVVVYNRPNMHEEREYTFPAFISADLLAKDRHGSVFCEEGGKRTLIKSYNGRHGYTDPDFICDRCRCESESPLHAVGQVGKTKFRLCDDCCREFRLWVVDGVKKDASRP